MKKPEVIAYTPPLESDPEHAEEIRHLGGMREVDVDIDAIPPASPEAWRLARRGPVTGAELQEMRRFFRPVKEPVSIRLDADILDWFRRQGRGWQTEINKALREHIGRSERD
ncbi:MAG: BrnA antitoxin family protein [Geminicoccaceae bacterium]